MRHGITCLCVLPTKPACFKGRALSLRATTTADFVVQCRELLAAPAMHSRLAREGNTQTQLQFTFLLGSILA